MLRELYFGGWVAHNIYFLGFGGVVWYKGLRIAGLSGIFNEKHYRCGHYESPPFSDDSMRSIYHLREIEVFRAVQMSSRNSRVFKPIDIFLSHDWPNNIWNYGDCDRLLRAKPFLAEDMRCHKLGSPPLMQLLMELKPSYWFSAHLHVKFAAIVPHSEESGKNPSVFRPPLPPGPRPSITAMDEGGRPEIVLCKAANLFTKFLALDKVLPGRYSCLFCVDFFNFIFSILVLYKYILMIVCCINRDFLQIVTIEPSLDASDVQINAQEVLCYDLEWLSIIRKTHELMSTSQRHSSLPTAFDLTTSEVWLKLFVLFSSRDIK